MGKLIVKENTYFSLMKKDIHIWIMFLSYSDRDKFCGEFHKRLINENGYYKLHKGYFIMEYRTII